jgi:3-methyladenine DNA glycosylase AlkD
MQLEKQILQKANPQRVEHSQRFFKTGKGEYGEGDVFLGLTVPEQRKIAKANLSVEFEELQTLLYSPYHEFRLVALFILTYQFEKFVNKREAIASFYIEHKEQVNNWDLVDSSAYKILGRYLFDKERSMLYDFISHPCLWVNRIAVVSTLYFIKKDDFDDAISIIGQSLQHPHDLMHKANGWMLREIGKRDEKTLLQFLDEHIYNMPRTTLRYAIERLDDSLKKDYMTR